MKEAVPVACEASTAGKDWFGVSTFESCSLLFEHHPMDVEDSPGVLRDDFVDRWGALWVGGTAGVAAAAAAVAGTTAAASPGCFGPERWVVGYLGGSAGVWGGLGWWVLVVCMVWVVRWVNFE